jgi:thioredoxin 1
MAAVNEWDAEAFNAALACGGVVIADFFAVWCGPCKMMMSVFEKAAAEFDDSKLKAGKINIDSARELAVKYNIRTIPTFMIFKDGQVVETVIGVQSQKALVNAINQAL